ncbi:MAG: cache domain-containing protein [Bacteroidota bacterium]|nr:cache domain-containing protein [Bacteroidota bacterium]
MKIRLKIRHKIQFFIILTTILIFVAAIGFISVKSKNMAFDDAIKISNNYVNGAANEVRVSLEKYLTTVVDLRNNLTIYKSIKEENRRKVISNMLITTLNKNSDFLAVWSTWEPNSIDNLDKLYENKKGSTVIGNYGHLYYKENGIIKLDESIESNAVSIYSGDYYQLPKKTKSTVIIEPYYYSYTKNNANEILETSIVSPIILENKFKGVVGIDINLEQFQDIIKKIKPFENSIAFLVSNKGNYIANPDTSFIGKSINELFPDEDEKYKVTQHIKEGKFLSYFVVGLDGSMYYSVYAPIKIGNTTTPWSIGIAVPIDEVMMKANQNFKISIIVGIIGLILLSIVIYIISNTITNPILKITNFLKRLAKGHIEKEMLVNINSGDEIEDMSIALNKSITGLLDKTKFANNMGNGDFETNLNLLSEDDVLGKSLLDMRNKLSEAKKQDELRVSEDKKRQWGNEGVATLGEILRLNYSNTRELSYSIISNLVDYLKANQGGIYVKNKDDKNDVYYELFASYAFNRRKYKKDRINIGEGLVGTCAIEKQTIYLTDIPDDYIKITSGLGGANPTSLLLIPLINDEEILGVIEIASFSTFEKHEIAFLEKISVNIASTLASVAINERTAVLLEQSQSQSEELASQEEEMRQNMEELQATQEEASRKTSEMESLLSGFDSSSFVTEYDTDGNIIYINNTFLNLIQLSHDEIIGTHHSKNLNLNKEEKENYNQFWNDLVNGKTIRKKTKLNINNKDYLFLETYTPIYNEDNRVIKILKIANDISEYLDK